MKTDIIQFPRNYKSDGNAPFVLRGDRDCCLLDTHDGRPWTANTLRSVVRSLRDFARLLEILANEKRGEETDEFLVEVQVYESVRVDRHRFRRSAMKLAKFRALAHEEVPRRAEEQENWTDMLGEAIEAGDVRIPPKAGVNEMTPERIAELRDIACAALRSGYADRAECGAALEEALDEIERLRAAVARHRHDIWGSRKVASTRDRELYRRIGV